MKSYLEISITANERQRELLLPTMIELGCQGFQETDAALLCYIEPSEWNDQKSALFQSAMKNILQHISSNAGIQFRTIQEENWNAEWEKTIQPIEIGKRFVIKPSWSTYQNSENRIIIQIDPKMSFGTGYHETTRLTLTLLEKYISKGMRVLDVGTGTGILAIAAIKLGADSAVGTDIDEWSIDNANENILANDVNEKIVISSLPLDKLPDTQFHCITANLTLNTNKELMEQFRAKLINNGVLLLSGLLLQDREEIIASTKLHNFSMIEELVENEWTALAVRKQS